MARTTPIIGVLLLAGVLQGLGAQPPRTEQPEDIQADLRRFKHALVVGHPNPYANLSPAEFDEFVDGLIRQAARPLDAVAFHRLVLQLTARIGDGHTMAFATGGTGAFLAEQGMLPFHVTVRHERIFVRRDLSEGTVPVGSEILSIDGVRSDQILRRILPHLGVDGGGTSARYHRLGSGFGSLAQMFPLIFGFRPRYDVTLHDGHTGRIRSIAVTALGRADFARIERERYGEPLYVGSFEEELARAAVRLRIEPAEGYAVLSIRRFFQNGFDEPASAFPALLRNAFREIAEASVSRLIVDLRGNGGGIGANAAHLVTYLSDSVFTPTELITLRGDDRYYAAAGIAPDTLRLGSYFGLEPRADDQPGFRVTNRERIPELGSFAPADEFGFRGKLVVLIDGGTVSAAGMAAGLLQHYTRAVFVGQETGGYAGMSNGIRQLTVLGNRTDAAINFPLAHSRFSVSPARRGRGVVPDHTVLDSIDDLRAGRDGVLAFALSLPR
jgi:hypothetical protein